MNGAAGGGCSGAQQPAAADSGALCLPPRAWLCIPRSMLHRHGCTAQSKLGAPAIADLGAIDTRGQAGRPHTARSSSQSDQIVDFFRHHESAQP